MKFSELYNICIKYWGISIDISDARKSGDSYYFPALSQLYSNVEEKVGHSDPWNELMIWTMFQIIHEEAVKRIKSGDSVLVFESVCKERIQEKFCKNLTSRNSDYLDLVAEYLNDLSHNE